MAGTYGRPAPDLKNELLSTGPSFSFFQVLRLLKAMGSADDQTASKPGTTAPFLKLRPNLSLSFPAAGVASVDESESGHFTVRANMLGLYGACSPLPTFYTEDLIDDEGNGDTTVRDVIDVINHRLYELLFESWTKYRSMLKIVEERDTAFLNRFFSLIGMDEDSLKREFESPERLLRYTGLFAMKARSAQGLESLISDAFGGISVRIIQMVERKGRIPDDQTCRLGESIRLGVSSNLGRTFSNRSGAFRIELGPLSDRDYRRFVPGSPDYILLKSLTRLYMNQPLTYEVEVIMDTAEKPKTLCLGGNKFSSLGLDTWVFSNKGPGEFRTRFCPDREAA